MDAWGVRAPTSALVNPFIGYESAVGAKGGHGVGKTLRWLGGLTAAAAGTLGAYRLIGRWLSPPNASLALAAGFRLERRRCRILALGAHPDDLDFFCGGTLHRLAAGGSHVTAFVASDGEKGGSWNNLAEIRQREQEQAAVLLGYSRLRFGHLPDGFCRYAGAADRVRRVLDASRPQVVFAPDPEAPLPFATNPDHVALGAIALDLVRRHPDRQLSLYLYATRFPDVLVDITDIMPLKTKALIGHKSQWRIYDLAAGPLLRLFATLPRGATPAKYVESFQRVF